MCGYSGTSPSPALPGAGISDADLTDAVERASRGLIDADLGGGVIKQRIARPGAGKSGGFRTIILLRIGSRAFFVHGFAKNDLGNIRKDEVDMFKVLAQQVLSLDDERLEAALRSGTFVEISQDAEAISQ